MVEPGPPVTSATSGCAAVRQLDRTRPAVVSFPFTQRSPTQPSPAKAPSATARPAVRRSSGVPPRIDAATRAAAALSADSASADAEHAERDDRPHAHRVRQRNHPGDVLLGRTVTGQRAGAGLPGVGESVGGGPGAERRGQREQPPPAPRRAELDQVRADPGDGRAGGGGGGQPGQRSTGRFARRASASARRWRPARRARPARRRSARTSPGRRSIRSRAAVGRPSSGGRNGSRCRQRRRSRPRLPRSAPDPGWPGTAGSAGTTFHSRARRAGRRREPRRPAGRP